MISQIKKALFVSGIFRVLVAVVVAAAVYYIAANGLALSLDLSIGGGVIYDK